MWEIPQRLKPDFFGALYGTAEAVPFPFLRRFRKIKAASFALTAENPAELCSAAGLETRPHTSKTYFSYSRTPSVFSASTGR
jgi:hypothetical protein